MRRPSPNQIYLDYGPRLTNAERDMLTENQHWRLAYKYVSKNGWRFINVIEVEEQIDICLLEMCRVLADWEPSRGRLSTFLNQCFFYKLAKEAKRLARYQAVRFSELAEGYADSLAGGEEIMEVEA